jgi:hypothetical protein
MSNAKIGFVCLGMSMLAGLLVAQEAGRAPRVNLSGPEASYTEPFSSIAGLRELADGRVIVSDRLELAVRIVDFGSGAMEEIGHVGQGPGEYQMPGDLFLLPNDSTLLVDYGNMRMTVIAPDGRLVGSTSMISPDGQFINPAGTDGQGRVYFEMMELRPGPAGAAVPDSAPIARLDRSTGAIDTVGFLEIELLVQASGSRTSEGMAWRGLQRAVYPLADAWAVSADGRVAVARSAEYRVEWLLEGGRSLVGPRIEYEPVPVTQEDKDAWADRMSRSTAVMMVAGGGGGRSGSRAVNLPRPDPDEMEWPEVKPPFPREAVTVTPEGEAWVRRHTAHGEPQTYDVFNASGKLVKQVVLPEGRTVLGFGRGTLYTFWMDQDELQWLERYRR